MVDECINDFVDKKGDIRDYLMIIIIKEIEIQLQDYIKKKVAEYMPITVLKLN